MSRVWKEQWFVCLTFIVFFSLFLQPVYAATITWSEVKPAGNANRGWQSIAISDNGRMILAGTVNEGLYVSRDAGTSWTDLGLSITGSISSSWYALAVSGDGQTMLGGVFGGRVYRSTDAGVSWSEVQPAGNTDKNWETMTMSQNGQIILVGANTGRLYKSTNGGTSWTETQPAGNTDQPWLATTMSSDGSKMLAAGYNARMYRSTNTGASWSEVRPAGDSDMGWITVATDDSGQTLLAGVDGNRMYMSTNGGSTWTDLQLNGDTDADWREVQVSADGQTLLGAYAVGTTATGRVYMSTNHGTSWTEIQPAGNADYYWSASAMTRDAYDIYLGVSGGRLYHGGALRPVATPSSNPGPLFHSTTDTPVCGEAAPVAAPDLFQIKRNGTQATLYFTPVSPASYYYVAFSEESYAERYGGEFHLDSSDGAQSITINFLKPSQQYYFKVRAGNGCMPGPWSSIKKS